MNRPKLQLALDMFDLPAALAPVQRAHDYIDVIECGTILCLSEGMHAVRAMKALYPDKIVLADVRIAEAGSIISKMCFDAGADWVSVVSGAAPASFEVVLAEAQARGRDMQIELSDGWQWEQVEHWRRLGVGQIITKRSRDAEAQGNLQWQDSDLDTIHKLADMGYKVSIAGGVKADDVARFAGVPVDVFIVGRAIAKADDPAAAAKTFQDAISAAYGAVTS
ncbi:MAG: orotidine 5'-phosphate decarboxylase / HUMPS family protein [Deinococcota bacterium]